MRGLETHECTVEMRSNNGRTIFASLARVNERPHVQKGRDFPQTKLDSGMNAHFLLN